MEGAAGPSTLLATGFEPALLYQPGDSFPDVLRPKWAHTTLGSMRVIARRTLREFVESRTGHKDHAALKAAVDAWFDEVRKAEWKTSADVKRRYPSASVVSADRIVFNIKGNDYRLMVSVDFEKRIAWIKWIGTHAAYDRIDVKEVEQ